MASSTFEGRTVAVLGNVGPTSPPYSTENEWIRAYEHHGITVHPFLEQNPEEWTRLIDLLRSDDRPDYVHWTSTPPWRLRLIPRETQSLMLKTADTYDVPTVGIHLDRFWNINEREDWIRSGDLYFRQSILFTADGGNEERWASAGINHRWLLPGVGEQYCHRGEVRDEYRGEVAFVGSWRNYHAASRHRRELVSFLQRTYNAKFWPLKRQPAIRGNDLTDLYWSTDVAVGDSFFVGRQRQQPPCCYSSDRITESLGRGAILAHPHVDGVTDGPFDVPSLSTWTAWQWKELRRIVDELLDMNQSVRTRKRNAGIQHILKYHTYERRVEEVMAELERENML